MMGNNFPHKQLLLKAQVLRLRKGFASTSSANIKPSKIGLHKIGKSGGFLGGLLRHLLKTEFPLIGHIPKQLAKKHFNTIRINSSSISNRYSCSGENVWIQYTTTLIISNEELYHE